MSKQKHMKAKDLKEVYTLLANGYSVTEVSKMMGRSYVTIWPREKELQEIVATYNTRYGVTSGSYTVKLGKPRSFFQRLFSV